MQRLAAGLLVSLTITGCQPSDARPDAGVDRAAVYGAAAGNVRPGQVTARLEQLLWDQRPPDYIRADLWHLVRASYDLRQYQPYWVGAGAPGRAAALAAAVCRAEDEGLRSADYHVDRLASELDQLRRFRAADRLGEFDLLLTGVLFAYGKDLLLGRIEPSTVAPEWDAGAPTAAAERVLQQTLAGTISLDSAIQALRPASAAYEALMAELQPLRAAEASGGWAEIPDDQVLRRGVRGPSVDALRRRLSATGELAASDTAGGRAFDRPLSTAVARFQARHGLGADGVAGRETIAALNVPAALRIAQVEANLERYRWIPENLLDRYALLDVPGSQLTMYGRAEPLTMSARLSESARSALPPVLADTISRVRLDPVQLMLAHHGGIQLTGRDTSDTKSGKPEAPAGGMIVVERPLELAALAAGRTVAEMQAALEGGAGATPEIAASLPIFMLDPTVRRDGSETRFTPAVPGRDVAIARALGPAQPQPAERCEALALAAASAVLSEP